MIYLLDTHVLLWTFFEPGKLSPKVKEIISASQNVVNVSSVSFWEISIKINTGKLRVEPENLLSFPESCLDAGFDLVNLDVKTASSFYQLTPTHHKDPFDRMLIWQALRNQYTLISDEMLMWAEREAVIVSAFSRCPSEL